jgi:hypothetical protein
MFGMKFKLLESKHQKQNTIQTGFKALDNVQGQGAERFKSGAYTLVREHFEPVRNTAIEH